MQLFFSYFLFVFPVLLAHLECQEGVGCIEHKRQHGSFSKHALRPRKEPPKLVRTHLLWSIIQYSLIREGEDGRRYGKILTDCT